MNRLECLMDFDLEAKAAMVLTIVYVPFSLDSGLRQEWHGGLRPRGASISPLYLA